MRLVAEPTTNSFSAVNEDGPEPLANFDEILAAGMAAAQSGDRASARRLLFQASALDPRCEDTWMWLASISEYPEELLIFLGNALDINPSNHRALEWRAATRSLLAKTFVQRAVAAHEEGAADRAEQCIQQALAFDSECEIAWLWKASLAQDENEKITFLEKVLEIDPDNVDARSVLDAILTERSLAAFNEVRTAAASGRRKKALELVDEFLRSEPNIADAWILRSHLSLGLDEKIESLKHALEIDPENTAARSAYDFLTATIGTNGEPDQENEDTSCAVDTSVAPLDNTPALVEKSLDSVFDLDQDAAGVEEPSQTADSTANEMFAIEEPDPATLVTEESFADETSDVFENTFIETFEPSVEELNETDGQPDLSSDTIALEEVRPLDPNATVSVEASELAEVWPPDEPLEYTPEPEREPVVLHPGGTLISCAFCGQPNEPQSFSCGSCNASLSLSDIERLLNNPHADREKISEAVTRMEAEWNFRDFDKAELIQLGIGHFNLGDCDSGVKYVQEAARLDPNNVILAGQLNTIAIRLDEIRRQREVHDAMPKGKRILVVDDSATVRKLIASKLEKSGHHVVCAEDGLEALECLEAGIPDLVLLDISMPRMDGYEVCKQIRDNPAAKDLPVVMISGKDGFFDKVRGKMAGSTGYVTKPFGPETLMKALETYLLPEPQQTEAS